MLAGSLGTFCGHIGKPVQQGVHDQCWHHPLGCHGIRHGLCQQLRRGAIATSSLGLSQS